MIEDVHTIRALLKRLIGERCPLTVFFDGEGDSYASMLLALDQDLGMLLADELHPYEGHLRVADGTSLRWVGRLDGVEVRFRTRVRAIDGDATIAAYAIEIPTALDHRERRKAYRTREVPTRPLRARLTALPDPRGEPATGSAPGDAEPPHEVTCLEAFVADISVDGVRLALQRPHSVCAPNQWSCALHLPGGAVATTVAVRHVLAARRRGEADRVGASFVELPDVARQRIGNYAAAIQRRRLRARAPLFVDLDT